MSLSWNTIKVIQPDLHQRPPGEAMKHLDETSAAFAKGG
jgi:hypothetical protein